jgi:hypothetical protein
VRKERAGTDLDDIKVLLLEGESEGKGHVLGGGSEILPSLRDAELEVRLHQSTLLGDKARHHEAR